MQILILIALGTFFILSVLFFIFYIKERYKKEKLASALKKVEDESFLMKKKYDCAFAELIQNKRQGYYSETISLVDSQDPNKTKPYSCIVYVQELDRYTNGECKLQLTNIEISSGFSLDQYDWVKKGLRERFVSVKPQKEITWLESEEDIKELRRQKLDKLKELGNGGK